MYVLGLGTLKDSTVASIKTRYKFLTLFSVLRPDFIEQSNSRSGSRIRSLSTFRLRKIPNLRGRKFEWILFRHVLVFASRAVVAGESNIGIRSAIFVNPSAVLKEPDR